jgi:hypothetical protein
MILTAHQPVFLPWLGLFHKIALSDKYVFLDSVQYLKQDWNNRNKIKTREGSTWLTVPVYHKDYTKKSISEIEICNDRPWRRKHWKLLEQNYRAAPYWKAYSPFYDDLYSRKWKRLTELNEYTLRWFLSTLNIPTEFVKASELDLEGRKSDLILEMCSRLDATTYVFGALGRDYARPEDFTRKNIGIVFQDYQHPTYPQQYDGFVSHLSIADLLFNCGPDSLEVLMSNNLTRAEMLNH